MPQTTQQQTGYTGYDQYRLPPGLEESMRQRYAEETARKRKGIAGTFKGKQRALQEQAARMGLIGPGRAAGEVGKGMYDLSAEQAAQEINAQRESEAAMGAEMLGASKSERAYQQQLESMKQGYGYQSQLLGQQQAGQMDIATLQAELQKELATQGWSEKAKMLQQQLTSAENIAGGQLGLGYAGLTQSGEQFGQSLGFEKEKWGDEYTLKEQALQQQMDIENLKADLVKQGWSEEAARQKAQQIWESGEAGLQREFATGEREGTQGFQQMMMNLQNEFTSQFETMKYNYAQRDQMMQSFYDFGQMAINDQMQGEYKQKMAQEMLDALNSYLPPELQVTLTLFPEYGGAGNEGSMYQTGGAS